MNSGVPEFLKEELVRQYGEEFCNEIIKGFEVARKSSFRVNTLKLSVEDAKCKLDKLNIKCEMVPWYEEAFIISNEDESVLRNSEMYEKGEIYFQSLSSMIPALVIEANENENILDMAAAPGGKTTHMFTLSKGKALITACEKNKIRAERLKYNLEKQGASKVNVMMQDARKLDDFFSFDKVLLDAPCSGSGTLNVNDEKQMKMFTKELIVRSVITQKEMLNKALKVLKVGHEMVYSTCSILREENEEQLKSFLNVGKIEIIPIDAGKFKGMEALETSVPGTICVCPDEMYEGFFIARMRRLK